ncbi:acyltransferase [Mucilaginibacter sp. NFR10]|uniref:acyltransferase family protein n=1 Tax=Mucilaginibacter sp. NFR10 TaxID=1566292 RepID=UPI000871B182|nr:acyltransferase [Mucilaginibacter sp. NFR10]SCW71630.1 Peptidoglycan/LPS O-acetylase OafA/YrhL, contains acyltransferase and SGNH-hydrolase domains [Mucilaginibacter sp. NFR10]
MEKLSPAILKTKQHFEILDGMRGIAAIAVVTFHFMEIAYSDYSKDFIGHGFLAVDFFFCLSGFVIGYAYDDRIDKMGIKEFFKSRLIRLHPLVVFGSVLGLLGFIFDPFNAQPIARSAGSILLLFLSSILMIPNPTMNERYFNLFGFNAPAWSLFWEYVVNIVYALVLCRLQRRYLIVLAAISAVGICYVAAHSGNLMGGWSGDTFWDGGVRIAYSFTAGLLVYRYNLIVKNKLGFIGLSILLMLAFLSPFSTWNWLTEPFIVIIYFPLMVSLGAGAVLNNSLRKICVFSGSISYPLYMTHYAVMWMFGNYYTANKPDAVHLAYIIIPGLVVLVTFAYLVMIGYDIPLRRYLTERKKKQAVK